MLPKRFRKPLLGTRPRRGTMIEEYPGLSQPRGWRQQCEAYAAKRDREFDGLRGIGHVVRKNTVVAGSSARRMRRVVFGRPKAD